MNNFIINLINGPNKLEKIKYFNGCGYSIKNGAHNIKFDILHL